jgi:hypothetical protein
MLLIKIQVLKRNTKSRAVGPHFNFQHASLAHFETPHVRFTHSEIQHAKTVHAGNHNVASDVN